VLDERFGDARQPDFAGSLMPIAATTLKRLDHADRCAKQTDQRTHRYHGIRVAGRNFSIENQFPWSPHSRQASICCRLVAIAGRLDGGAESPGRQCRRVFDGGGCFRQRARLLIFSITRRYPRPRCGNT